MIRTLIVDDDSLIHVTMRTIIDWEQYGFTVVKDCNNGAQALHYLDHHPVDLLITDIKMPGMSGLALLTRLRQRAHMPVTVVISGYDEFELVREAFRLGAYDYLLKSDIHKEGIERLLMGLRKKVFQNHIVDSPTAIQTNELPPKIPSGEYAVAVFQVLDFTKVAQRFGENLRERMDKPMLELVLQIHRLHNRAIIRAESPGCYQLFYRVHNKNSIRDTIVSVAQQVQAIWRDFMNLEVAVGISDVVEDQKICSVTKRCETLCKLSILQGRGKICTQWQHGDLAQQYEQQAYECDNLIALLCREDEAALSQEIGTWVCGLNHLNDLQHIQKILVLLGRLGERLNQYGQNYFAVFPEEIDFFQTLMQLDTKQDREIWLRNLLRRVHESCSTGKEKKQRSAIERAQIFMQDNFNNPELSLKTVADFVGFNEKYFSTRFAKECGSTFISYLNDLRIQQAQELLCQTDMKMYEISEAVGYRSTEHFNHMFKKKLCISPREYRQNAGKT